MKMRFLPDTPIQTKDDDLLEFEPFVSLIKSSLQMTEPPFVYGVLGDWGTGKTSILHLLQEQFDHERRANNATTNDTIFIPIWFNAWKYENETNLIYPLLHAIKKQYETENQRLQDARTFMGQFGKVAATGFYVASDMLLKGITKKLTDEAIGLEKLEDGWAKMDDKMVQKLGTVMSQVDALETQFAALLKAYAEDVSETPEKVRFVILIDDLDRCLPETTIAILESIKNYLLVEQCIFVLALNSKVVYQGIRAKYKGLEIDGREYLEKILNYSFYVPEPALDSVKQFASQRLTQLIPEETDRNIHLTKFTQFGEVLEACHFNNPRKIKRILNRFLLFLGQDDIRQYNIANVIRLIVLAEYYPILFGLLHRYKDADAITDILTQARTKQYANLEQYDITIPSTYPPLSRIQELFKLVTSGQSPRKEIEAVHQITRLI